MDLVPKRSLVNKPVVIDLDDFCEANMTTELWDNLFTLKRVYPGFKVTMFTIPLLCSTQWLKMVHERYDWIEMHYHGTDHRDRDEWFDKDSVELSYSEYFYRGFKAPWWRMDQQTANVLDAQGYLISTRVGRFDIIGERVYRFNMGKEILKNVWYENEYQCFHSHVQHQTDNDGLPDIFSMAKVAFAHDSKFLFISEILL